MMKKVFHTIIQTEIDTDTGKSRVLKQFTFPVGDKPKAKIPKPLYSNFEEELV